MSRTRYGWWGYVKDMIRRYPELCRELEDLHTMPVTAQIKAVGGSSGAGRRSEIVAIRELPYTRQREYAAVRRAIEVTKKYNIGAEIINLIDLVFWRQTHTLHGAAIKCNIAYITAARWHGDFIRLVAKNYGLMD